MIENEEILRDMIECHKQIHRDTLATLKAISNIATLAWTDPPSVRDAFEDIKRRAGVAIATLEKM